MAIRDDAAMQIECFPARDIDDRLSRQIAVLLGRAFTDERHVSQYSAEQHAELDEARARVHGRPPARGELMPEAYLANFPTLRNLARPSNQRRECEHFVALADSYAACHVSLFAQHFRFEDLEVPGGYVEDVATDPLHIGKGFASEAMRAAESRARELGLGVLGLATGIAPFYERLGWQRWNGGHTFQVVDFGLSYPDEPLMLLPLTAAGIELQRRSGQMMSWRLWQFGEQPAVS